MLKARRPASVMQDYRDLWNKFRVMLRMDHCVVSEFAFTGLAPGRWPGPIDLDPKKPRGTAAGLA